MKIHSSLPAPAVQPRQSEPRPSEKRQAEAATSVTLSNEARWIANVSDEARNAPDIRLDVVERTRQALADGLYERAIDMDAVIGRLVRDL
jgi:anti-sigma28 factor (negative regulator of flagellin synthesis)